MPKLHLVYLYPARLRNFTVEDGILYMKKIFTQNIEYIKLHVFPASFYNIIFAAFHANPIGGHLDAFSLTPGFVRDIPDPVCTIIVDGWSNNFLVVIFESAPSVTTLTLFIAFL